MKNTNHLLYLTALLCSMLFFQYVSAQKIITSQDLSTYEEGFDKMLFEAEINKTEYSLLEPITVKFKFSNPTDEWVKASQPQFTTQTKVRMSYNGESYEFGSIFGYSAASRHSLRLFKPGELIEESGTLKSNNGFFAKPGKYQIQFILESGDKPDRLTSAIFEITVKQPTGIDKEAFDFLRRNKFVEGSSDLFFFKGRNNEDRLNLLETFVDKYGTSIYGEYAILSLGDMYEFNGQLNKAKTEFMKIKDSENTLLATSAQKSLTSVENKIKEQELRNNLNEKLKKPQ